LARYGRYNAVVFDILRMPRPSPRGEPEITNMNNIYPNRGLLPYEILRGWWSGAGTFESLHRARNLVARTGANNME
jgi:glucose-1-phosphate thymidylyltransferase